MFENGKTFGRDMIRTTYAILLIQATLCTAFAGETADKEIYSRNQIRDMIYENPARVLPEHKGANLLDIVQAYVTMTGKFVRRSKATFQDESEFKPASSKFLHPRGVCATGSWVINQDLGYTGLFSKGTPVPVIVRISSGDANSVYKKDKKRIFGISVKHFLNPNPDVPAHTVNMFTLNDTGFAGTFRRGIFWDESGKEVVFTNRLGSPMSRLAKILAKFFDRFDMPNNNRPIYPQAEVDRMGVKVQTPVVPYRLKFVPDGFGDAKYMAQDFREEILNYPTDNFRLKIYLQESEENQEDKLAGFLKIDSTMVSDFCDTRLHFHHHPNERARYGKE